MRTGLNHIYISGANELKAELRSIDVKFRVNYLFLSEAGLHIFSHEAVNATYNASREKSFLGNTVRGVTSEQCVLGCTCLGFKKLCILAVK